MPIDVAGVVYGSLVTLGGVIGYLKAGSIPSLIAGVTSGCIAGFGAYFSNFYILLSVGLVLGALMTVRFFKSGKFIPAGLIAILSILIVIRCIVYFVKKI